ncbi:MAG: retron St85 family RNA-directed DNA polymerase [Candidatus Sedimenticola sp. (ex Thyasira tokunagai)]
MNILGQLHEFLCTDRTQIINFASTAPYRYKVYQIPKRNSTLKRTIAHPSKELKFIQRLLIRILEPSLSIHECAFAYRSGIGIKDNAKEHMHSKYLLKMDFKNFFQSITPDLFFHLLDQKGFDISETDKTLLTGLLFWRPKRRGGLVLSIGAPTSPMISNFIMNEFDQFINQECNQRSITYTRYADDITFSTLEKGALFSIPELVKKVLHETSDGKILINRDKTVFSSRAHNRHVTGITITNDMKLSIGRNKKRLISSMIHKHSHHLLSKEDFFKLKGLLSYARHIEPLFYSRMKSKYSHELLEEIKCGNPDLP